MINVTAQRKHHREEHKDSEMNLSIPLGVSFDFDIDPKVKVGEVKAYPGKRKIYCRKNGQYVMYQLICVEIPLDINVEIDSPDNSQ